MDGHSQKTNSAYSMFTVDGETTCVCQQHEDKQASLPPIAACEVTSGAERMCVSEQLIARLCCIAANRVEEYPEAKHRGGSTDVTARSIRNRPCIRLASACCKSLARQFSVLSVEAIRELKRMSRSTLALPRLWASDVQNSFTKAAYKSNETVLLLKPNYFVVFIWLPQTVGFGWFNSRFVWLCADQRGSGGLVVRLLAFHLGKQDLSPEGPYVANTAIRVLLEIITNFPGSLYYSTAIPPYTASYTGYGAVPKRRGGGNGRSPRKPADSCIVRHDSHMRKSGVTRPGSEPGSSWWEASGLTAQPPWPHDMTRKRLPCIKSRDSYWAVRSSEHETSLRRRRACRSRRVMSVGHVWVCSGACDVHESIPRSPSNKAASVIMVTGRVVGHGIANCSVVTRTAIPVDAQRISNYSIFFLDALCSLLAPRRTCCPLLLMGNTAVGSSLGIGKIRGFISGQDRLQTNTLDDSTPIADFQGNKKRIPYCQMWGNTGTTAHEQTSEVRLYKGLHVCSSAGMKWKGKREIPKKTRRPAALSSTILACENPGVTRPGIEPGSPWWEASKLTAQLPRSPMALEIESHAGHDVIAWRPKHQQSSEKINGIYEKSSGHSLLVAPDRWECGRDIMTDLERTAVDAVFLELLLPERGGQIGSGHRNRSQKHDQSQQRDHCAQLQRARSPGPEILAMTTARGPALRAQLSTDRRLGRTPLLRATAAFLWLKAYQETAYKITYDLTYFHLRKSGSGLVGDEHSSHCVTSATEHTLQDLAIYISVVLRQNQPYCGAICGATVELCEVLGSLLCEVLVEVLDEVLSGPAFPAIEVNLARWGNAKDDNIKCDWRSDCSTHAPVSTVSSLLHRI
ncbi:hypothetical protein PR048_014391 [Dryococelus australis]|uniref:Uncharacterized protein n=1 Tax=Dryococelus australis TaxID=614101 RepID=A0ABQ9HEA7_9NEOP|nr:hypothetical protein PR048_014391 [Dryococelus australis]